MNKKLFLYFLIASHITQCNISKLQIFGSYFAAGLFGIKSFGILPIVSSFLRRGPKFTPEKLGSQIFNKTTLFRHEADAQKFAHNFLKLTIPTAFAGYAAGSILYHTGSIFNPYNYVLEENNKSLTFSNSRGLFGTLQIRD
jgi:hypothetical protein